jgi:hypothetical protein
MLAPVDVSAEVERVRRDDPYHLTSTMVAMGSLVTEGTTWTSTGPATGGRRCG